MDDASVRKLLAESEGYRKRMYKLAVKRLKKLATVDRTKLSDELRRSMTEQVNEMTSMKLLCSNAFSGKLSDLVRQHSKELEGMSPDQVREFMVPKVRASLNATYWEG